LSNWIPTEIPQDNTTLLLPGLRDGVSGQSKVVLRRLSGTLTSGRVTPAGSIIHGGHGGIRNTTPLHTPSRRSSRVRVGSFSAVGLQFLNVQGEPTIEEIESSTLIGSATIGYDQAFYSIDRELVIQLQSKTNNRLPS